MAPHRCSKGHGPGFVPKLFHGAGRSRHNTTARRIRFAQAQRAKMDPVRQPLGPDKARTIGTLCAERTGLVDNKDTAGSLDHDRFGTPPRDLAGPIDKIVVSDRDRAPSQPRCPTTGMRRQTGLCRQGNRDLRWPLDQANVGTVSRYRQRGVPGLCHPRHSGLESPMGILSTVRENIRNCISMSMGHQRPGLCRAIRRSAVSRK